MSCSISFNSVSRSYPGGDKPALNNISFTVAAGQTLVLLGRSGSGKSTVLRLASGLDRPDSGEIRIDDEIVADAGRFLAPEKRNIGMIFQDGALFPHLTVMQNAIYGLHHLPKAQRQNAASFLLAMAGLQAHGSRYPHELSGGERQRLAVVRALAPKPRALLLDEPFSNLDRGLKLELRDEIAGILQKFNTTAILVTHEIDDALRMGDSVAVLDYGQIIQHGLPNEIYNSPNCAAVARLSGATNHLPQNPFTTEQWFRPIQVVWSNSPLPNVPAFQVQVAGKKPLGHLAEITVLPRDFPRYPSLRWRLLAPVDQDLLPGHDYFIRCDEITNISKI